MVDVILQLERITRSKEPVPALRPCDRKYACVHTPAQRAHYLIGIDVAKERCGEFAQLFAQQLDFSAFTRGAGEGMSVTIDVVSDASRIFDDHAQVVHSAAAARKARKGQEEELAVESFHSVRAEGVFREREEEEESGTTVIPPAEDNSAPTGR